MLLWNMVGIVKYRFQQELESYSCVTICKLILFVNIFVSCGSFCGTNYVRGTPTDSLEALEIETHHRGHHCYFVRAVEIKRGRSRVVQLLSWCCSEAILPLSRIWLCCFAVAHASRLLQRLHKFTLCKSALWDRFSNARFNVWLWRWHSKYTCSHSNFTHSWPLFKEHFKNWLKQRKYSNAKSCPFGGYHVPKGESW